MKNRHIAFAAIFMAGIGIASMLHADGPAVGSKAPDFSLTDSTGKTHALSDYKGRIVVLEWTNFGCPFVRKHYDTGNMQKLQKTYGDKGIIWLSVCSSGKDKEGNFSPTEWNKAIAKEKAKSMAFLIDEDGKVGHTYAAKTTPHMFIIAADGTLAYKGAIDNKPSTQKSDVASATNYVSAALDEILAGKKVTTASTESYGCSVKYAK